MRKVVDINYLQSTLLEEYLGKSQRNYVVFPEFVCLESFKGDSLENIRSNLQIVSQFPRQVIILKSGTEILKLKPHASGLQKRLIDKSQTKDFDKFSRDVLNDSNLTSHFLDRAKTAKSVLDRLSENHVKLIKGMSQMSDTYLKPDLDLLRKNGWASPRLVNDLARNIFQSAQQLFKIIVDIDHEVPSWPEVCNTFPFRYATCCQVYVLVKIKHGSCPASPSVIRNQFIDLNHVAYATFFDGILTRETIVNDVYAISRNLLDQFKGESPRGIKM